MRRLVASSWIVVPLACTRLNPAFEDGGDAGTALPTTEGAATSTTRGGGEDEPGASDQADGTGSSTRGAATGDTGDTGRPLETGTTGEPPPEEPPQVGPFDPPTVVEVSVELHQDDDPTLTGDMLELYFSSTRPGGGEGLQANIWVARRELVDDPWDEPMPVLELNSAFRDNTPEIHVDGLMLLMVSDREDVGLDQDVYVSRRPDRESEWSPPERVEGLSTNQRDVCPFLADDQEHVYSCVGPDFLQDLVRFDLVGRGRWSVPSLLDDVNTPGSSECAAWLDGTQRVIAFASNRRGGDGDFDVWLAERDSVEEPFGKPVPLEELNEPSFDDDPWVSPDGGTIYFASNRNGDLDIYVAYRSER